MIPQYENLVGKLELASSKIPGLWQKTSDRDKFSVRINSTTILMNSYIAFPNTDDCISFEVMNSKGEIIDGIYVDSKDFEYKRLKKLYESARRNALRIPETLSDVVTGLDQLLAKNGITGNSNNDNNGLPF